MAANYQNLVIKLKIDIKDDDILLIMKNLSVDEALRWDQWSVRMIKACRNSISFKSKLIFKSVINVGVFPKDWNKSNIVPVHERNKNSLTTTGL